MHLDEEGDRRMKDGPVFEMQGSCISKDIADSHNPLGTLPPLRRMSTGLKEGQLSLSRQATLAPCRRHCLCIRCRLKRVKASIPFPQKGRCWGVMPTVFFTVSRGAGTGALGTSSRYGNVRPIDTHFLGHPSRQQLPHFKSREG